MRCHIDSAHAIYGLQVPGLKHWRKEKHAGWMIIIVLGQGKSQRVQVLLIMYEKYKHSLHCCLTLFCFTGNAEHTSCTSGLFCYLVPFELHELHALQNLSSWHNLVAISNCRENEYGVNPNSMFVLCASLLPPEVWWNCWHTPWLNCLKCPLCLCTSSRIELMLVC